MSTSIRQFMSANANALTPSFEEHAEELDVVVPEQQEVSDDELYEAEDILDEVEEEREETAASVELYKNIETEAEEIAASVENYMEVLSLGIESGQFSPQFAAVADTELKRLSSIYGGDIATPSLEDFNHDNLGEFYAASLEGFKEVVGKVRNTVVSAAKKSRDYVASIGTNEKAAKALITKADAALAKLEGSEFDGKSIALKGLGKVFTHDGQVPSNILSAINSDQKGLGVLANKHLQNTVSYYEEALKVGGQAIKEPSKGVTAIEAFAKKPTPNEQIAKSVQLLGVKVNAERSTESSSNTGSGVVNNLVDTLSIQSTLTERQKKADGNITLTKDQVSGLLKAVKVYAGQLEVLNRAAKKELARQVKIDKELVAAAGSQGTSTGGSFSPFMAYAGSFIGSTVGLATGGVAGAVAGSMVGSLSTVKSHVDQSGSDVDVALRNLGKVVSNASSMPVSHFKEIAKIIEHHAKMCLKLADRAMSGKAAKEDDKDDE